MDAITVIGLAAAAVTTISLFPQLIKVCKTKSTRDISLGMFSLFSIGVFLWFLYGILMNDVPIILGNLVGLVQGLIILAFKVKYK
jgi:MtN3 and saliva related transmembrane protein